jgi:DNA-binding transcriptional LysR family regulator
MFERLFSRRGLSVDRLRVLCEVAEAGSIVRAAGSDPVRQSQFSRQLKELEDFFEVELTRRQGKRLVLTENGKELVQIARESIGRLHDFQLRASNQPLTFSIGGGDSLVHWLVLPRLAALQDSLPDINLRLQNLRTAEVISRLQELSLDFGLVRRDALTDPLAAFPIGKMEYALFCPKALVRSADPPSPRQLGDDTSGHAERCWRVHAPVSRLGGGEQLGCFHQTRMRLIPSSLPVARFRRIRCDSPDHRALGFAERRVFGIAFAVSEQATAPAMPRVESADTTPAE